MRKAGYCPPGPVELVGLRVAATAEQERRAWEQHGKELQPPYGESDSEDEHEEPDRSNELVKETIFSRT